MMKKKMVIALGAAVLLSAGLGGCGAASVSEQAAGSTPAAEETAGADSADAESASGSSAGAETDVSESAKLPLSDSSDDSAEASGSGQISGKTITVTQRSTQKLTPDMASVVFSVQENGDTPEEAQEESSAACDSVIKALEAAGVEEKSIQTTDYYMSPEYDYSGDTEKLTGYQVTVNLTVTDLTVDETGDILDAGVKGGASGVYNVEFTSSEYDEAYEKALQKALSDSYKKAEALAETAGSSIEGVQSVTEGYQDDSQRYDSGNTYYGETASAADSAGAAVMPGQLEIDAEITVVYTMK